MRRYKKEKDKKESPEWLQAIKDDFEMPSFRTMVIVLIVLIPILFILNHYI